MRIFPLDDSGGAMTAMQVPGPGDVFRGHRIEGEIGRGGMGVVYLAEHLHLARKVALKLLPSHLAEDDTFRERFKRESQLAASLRHPNIVPIFDAGEDDGILFISMAYISGSDLKAIITTDGPLPLDRAVALLEQVADALDEAHENDLVHRDIKPQNILVEAPGGRRATEHAYLADFGLTKHRGSRTMTAAGTVVGTVDYMPPEQLHGGDLDGRTDVYALGCVLFECLTGRSPFARDSDIGTITAHLQEPPPALSGRRPDVPPQLDAIVATALAKVPEERFATCGELLGAVRRVVSELPTEQMAGPGGTVVAPVAAPPVDTMVAPPGIGGTVVAPGGAPPPWQAPAAGATVVAPGTASGWGPGSAGSSDAPGAQVPPWTPPPVAQPGPYSRQPGPHAAGLSRTVLGSIEAIGGALLVLAALLPWVTVVYTAACSPGCPLGVQEFQQDARNGLEIVNRLGLITLVLGAVLIGLGIWRLASARELPSWSVPLGALPAAGAAGIALVKLLHLGEQFVQKGSLELRGALGLFLTLAVAVGIAAVAAYATATARRRHPR